MRDGSSGRTLVKQGMTLRTRQRDLECGKFQPYTHVWELWLRPPFWCVFFFPLQNSVFSADREDVTFDRLAVFASEVKKQNKAPRPQFRLSKQQSSVVSLLNHAFLYFGVELFLTHMLESELFFVWTHCSWKCCQFIPQCTMTLRQWETNNLSEWRSAAWIIYTLLSAESLEGEKVERLWGMLFSSEFTFTLNTVYWIVGHAGVREIDFHCIRSP